jgi:general secretion pathway protein K
MKHKHSPDERGFALLVVLGLLGLLALLGARLTSAARTEARIAFALRASAAAEVADSAVNEVAMRLLRGTWPVSGLAWRVPPEPILVGAVAVDVLVMDETVKINPNYASSRLLRSLMIQAGVDESTAASLADAIIEWRQPSAMSSGGDRKRTRYETSGLACELACNNDPLRGVFRVQSRPL